VTNRKVSPARLRTKAEVSDALAADWLRLAPTGKRASFSLNIGGDKDGKVVSKAISGEHLPEAHTILNSLVVDPTALFETLQLYNIVAVCVEPGECDDNAAISQMLRAATEYFERMKDGVRDRADTFVLAELFRPLIPAMLCVMREATAMKGRGA
jgi:hypothetical protein